MHGTNPYKAFVARYLGRGAVGISVGLAAIAPASTAHGATNSSQEAVTGSFSERLQIVRSAVSEEIKEPDSQGTKIAFTNFTNFTNFRNFKNFTNFKNSRY